MFFFCDSLTDFKCCLYSLNEYSLEIVILLIKYSLVLFTHTIYLWFILLRFEILMEMISETNINDEIFLAIIEDRLFVYR